MDHVRIGNNCTLLWRIFRKGSPEDLPSKNLEIYLLDHNDNICPISYTISGNEITILFLGRDQKELGVYSLLLIENRGGEAQGIVDKINAFSLVPHSYQENVVNEVKTNELSSDIALPSNGMSAYEVAVSRGFVGDIDAWLKSLRGKPGEKGDKGDKFTWDEVTDEEKTEMAESVVKPLLVDLVFKGTPVDQHIQSIDGTIPGRVASLEKRMAQIEDLSGSSGLLKTLEKQVKEVTQTVESLNMGTIQPLKNKVNEMVTKVNSLSTDYNDLEERVTVVEDKIEIFATEEDINGIIK